jgi:hypothetical protein
VYRTIASEPPQIDAVERPLARLLTCCVGCGLEPAHPGSGEQPAGRARCGLEARAPWQFRQDAAGIESRPKFISVAVWGARFWERSTLSIAFLRYIDCSYSSCRARPSLPLECRPKFISVAVWGARFWERSILSIAFLRYIDCSYSSCRARPSLPLECRPKFISVAVWGARFWERSTLSN